MTTKVQSNNNTHRRIKKRQELDPKETEAFLNRPVKKLQDLNRSLKKSYEKGFFNRPQFNHFQILKSKRANKDKDSIESQQNNDSDYNAQQQSNLNQKRRGQLRPKRLNHHQGSFLPKVYPQTNATKTEINKTSAKAEEKPKSKNSNKAETNGGQKDDKKKEEQSQQQQSEQTQSSNSTSSSNSDQSQESEDEENTVKDKSNAIEQSPNKKQKTSSKPEPQVIKPQIQATANAETPKKVTIQPLSKTQPQKSNKQSESEQYYKPTAKKQQKQKSPTRQQSSIQKSSSSSEKPINKNIKHTPPKINPMVEIKPVKVCTRVYRNKDKTIKNNTKSTTLINQHQQTTVLPQTTSQINHKQTQNNPTTNSKQQTITNNTTIIDHKNTSSFPQPINLKRSYEQYISTNVKPKLSIHSKNVTESIMVRVCTQPIDTHSLQLFKTQIQQFCNFFKHAPCCHLNNHNDNLVERKRIIEQLPQETNDFQPQTKESPIAVLQQKAVPQQNPAPPSTSPAPRIQQPSPSKKQKKQRRKARK